MALAPTAWNDWSSGDVVTLAKIQAIQDQTINIQTTTTRDALSVGAGSEGSMVYNTTLNSLDIYTGSAWQSLIDIDSFDTSKIELNKDSGSAYVQVTSAHDTEATTPYFIFRKSDGSTASPALVDDDAILGTISFQGYDGNSFATGATIQCLVDGSPGDGDMPTEMIFSTSADGSESPTARMAIGPDGSVGIGTTAPDQPLHIVTSGTDAYIKQDDGTTAMVGGPDGSGTGLWGTTTNHPIRFLTNNTERFRIDTSGLITSPRSYSATTGNSANLVVYDSGGGFYRSTSSRKYKTDIEDMQDSWADKILGLRPVWYRSTCAPDNDAWSYWGFIAEEVDAIDPRLVHHDNDGTPEGVQYDRIVPHLVNLLKRQDARIKALEDA
jgi:hypothetical protein